VNDEEKLRSWEIVKFCLRQGFGRLNARLNDEVGQEVKIYDILVLNRYNNRMTTV